MDRWKKGKKEEEEYLYIPESSGARGVLLGCLAAHVISICSYEEIQLCSPVYFIESAGSFDGIVGYRKFVS